MKRIIAFLLALITCVTLTALTSCDKKEQGGNESQNGGSDTARTTVSETEWKAALAKANFYNVTLNYVQYSRSDDGNTSESATLFKYDGDLMSGNGRVKANNGDMDTEEVANMVGFGLDSYFSAEYDSEDGNYFVKVYNDYYEMYFGLIYRFEDGRLVHFELHFLDGSGNTDGMYKSRWHVCDFSDYGTTVVSEE